MGTSIPGYKQAGCLAKSSQPSPFLSFPSWLLILRSEPQGTLSNLLEQSITNCSCCGLGSRLPSLLLLEGNWEEMQPQHPSTCQSLHLDRITSEAGNFANDWKNGRRQKCSDGQLGKGRPHCALGFPH